MDRNINDIKPARAGVSDFYSWQLYRWARKRPYALQIWRGTWNSVTGVDPDREMLYVGAMEVMPSGERWFHGRMLRNLCLVNQDLMSYAYGPAHDTANWIEITAAWWAQYRAQGVCAIHGDRAHDWIERGERRHCRHCDKRQQRVAHQVLRREWVDVSDAVEVA